MKKILLIATFALSASVVLAQDEMTSKKGTPILPEVGDYWIGVDAVPFLDYFGNLMNSGNSAPSWDFTNSGMAITGGMVKDANTSYRGKIRLGIGSNKVNYSTDNDATTDPNDQSFDEAKTSSNNILLGAGIQKNRGKGRLRGLYGAEAYLMFGGGKTTYSYANAYSATNTNPSSGIPGQNGANPRTTESKNGSMFGFGVRSFVGVEYFFAPKMSVAGEFGWGLAISSTGEGEVSQEGWDPTLNSGAGGVTSSSSKTGKSSSFGFDTDNSGGSIILSFYF
ncbi:MAG TPA: hypothetical protein VFW78_12850 [Bacteroidia bacterium]|nr:hypothetical protein [Bacteroidia bacterium]